MLEINISPMDPLCEVMEAMAEQGYPLVKMSVEDAQNLMSLADRDYEFFFTPEELAETWNQVLDDNKADMITAYEIWRDIDIVRVDFERPSELGEDEEAIPVIVCNGEMTESIIPEKAGTLIPAYLCIKDHDTFKAFARELESLHLGFDYDYEAYNWGLRRYLRATI